MTMMHFLLSSQQKLYLQNFNKRNNFPFCTFFFTEMPRAVKGLITNKINLFNNLAGVFYIFSAIGYWTYMPKYLETIFMQTAVNASVISGKLPYIFFGVI